jgi:hypothetical protein
VPNEQSLDGRPKLGPDVVAHGPVRPDITTHDRHEFTSDVGQNTFALLLDGRFVQSYGVVERELVLVQWRCEVCASVSFSGDLLRKLNQFRDDLCRGGLLVGVLVHQLRDPPGKGALADHVVAGGLG